MRLPTPATSVAYLSANAFQEPGRSTLASATLYARRSAPWLLSSEYLHCMGPCVDNCRLASGPERDPWSWNYTPEFIACAEECDRICSVLFSWPALVSDLV